MTQPTKKDTVVWISDGVLTMSGDITEHREGMLTVAEHHLLGFGSCMSAFECEGFLQNEAELKRKFQDFYDAFMVEFDYYAESLGTGLHGCPDYRISPKPDALKYSEDEEVKAHLKRNEAKEEVAA
ncbi:hypothetical protein [Tichowtungia aerotolerans]|uniref:Uncharacterized protein n=1 Tax=Tichowtungia aerotolerans TaxID=2697043 RepID=A0A6P1M3W8_9BACT|nr:hypothetical protein [Tichowtungia aerotolerans]QHI69539.1 hypothetical protein GT409_08740 [Tichowtungia aerotolerans]